MAQIPKGRCVRARDLLRNGRPTSIPETVKGRMRDERRRTIIDQNLLRQQEDWNFILCQIVGAEEDKKTRKELIVDKKRVDEILALGSALGINMGNPAALSAFCSGDLENALVASKPGGIEAQEAAGQSWMISAGVLPKKSNLTREQIKGLGFVFGEDCDDQFVKCNLPEGWAIKPTDHSMWSGLFDDKGRERAGIFYKAAFYDRHAHICFDKECL